MARTSVTRAYGTGIRVFLSQKLGNRFVASLTGTGAATILQSSTAVALFLASMAAQGGIPVVGGLALMLGADVGSAAVAVLLSLNLKAFWPLFVAGGYILHALGDESRPNCRQLGRFLLGLGMVLIALTFMGQVSGALADSYAIPVIIGSLAEEPVLAVLVLAVLTWLTHSSMAVLLFVASLAGIGVVADPVLVVACILGINLGGGVPAIVMTLAQPVVVRRIIWGNGLFRLLGVAAGLIAIVPLAKLFSRFPGEWGVRVVFLHIVFNLSLAIVFLPLLGRFAALLSRLFPDGTAASAEEYGPRYIAPLAGSYAAVMPLSALTREALRMSDLVLQMLVDTGDVLRFHAREGKSKAIRQMDDKVDVLYEAIRTYAIDLTRSEELQAGGMRRIIGLFRYAVGLENTGNLIKKSLLETVDRKNRSKRSFSEDGDAELGRLFAYVVETMQIAAEVVMSWDTDTARQLQRRDAAFEAMIDYSSVSHIERLRRGVSGSIETSSFHLDIINDLQRINRIAVAVSSDVVTADVEEHEEEKLANEREGAVTKIVAEKA